MGFTCDFFIDSHFCCVNVNDILAVTNSGSVIIDEHYLQMSHYLINDFYSGAQ